MLCHMMHAMRSFDALNMCARFVFKLQTERRSREYET